MNNNLSTTGEKENYRTFYLNSDIKQARLGLAIILFSTIAFIFNDYDLFGLSSPFYLLSLLRAGMFTYTLFMIFILNTITRYDKYDKSVTVWEAAIGVFSVIIALTRPATLIVNQTILVVLFIFIICLVIPNRLLYQAITSSILTIGFLGVALLNFNVITLTALLSVLVSSPIAIAVSLRIMAYRKRSYQETENRQKTEKELEKYTKNLENIVKERTEKLKDAERLAAIGATAGMVGHDIRNPLQVILGDLYLINSELAKLPESEEKESAKESLSSIRKSAEYIDKIVQDLQDYAKPLKPNVKETDFEKICQEVLLESNFPEDVEVKYVVEDEARNIVADPAFLKRILMNLTSNAVQAMPYGGNIEIRAYRERGEVVITVQDSGVGIPEEYKPNLFTPLFTTKAKGQGFGLPVVKRMTEALGGTVTFESEEGKGAKFKVCFPAIKK